MSDELRIVPDFGKLTERQQRFVEEYCKNGNIALRAARDAGYKSPRDSSRDLMEHPGILAAIVERKGEIEAQSYARGMRLGELADAHVEKVLTSEAHEKRGWQDHNVAAELAYRRAGLLQSTTSSSIHVDIEAQFRGRTREELRYFVEHGYWPQDVLSPQPGIGRSASPGHEPPLLDGSTREGGSGAGQGTRESSPSNH